ERLAILAYHSKFFDLNYEKMAKFEKFLGDTGSDKILARHRAAGKPETGIDERYYRAAKLLLNVGGNAMARTASPTCHWNWSRSAIPTD
ncbi:MAG: hypothetical protein HOK54_13355, partial [Alphaproteobacteria bacterium]|nr:hypothetical protein [Alphaproteobacteria bacterium]